MIRRLLQGEKSRILADQAVVSGCSLLTQLLLAGKLGLAGYGYFSVVVIAQIFLLSLQQAGITGVYQVLFPGMPAGERPAYDTGVTSMQAAQIAALLMVGAIYCAIPQPVFSAGDRVAVVLNVVFFLQQDFYRKSLLTRGRAGATLLVDLVNNGLQLAGMGLLLICDELRLTSALWVCALSYVPALLLGQISTGKLAVSATLLAAAYQKHKGQGSWMLLSAFLQWCSGNLYMIAAGWWLGLAALGALRLGQYLFGLLHVLMQAIESYSLPKAAGIAHDPALAAAYLKALMRKMLLLMLPLLLLITGAGKPMLRLLGKGELEAAFTILSGLSLTYLFVTVAYPIRIALRIFRLNRAYFNGYAISAAFAVATAWSLIRSLGVWGVMTGLVASQIILISYWLFTLQKHHTILWKSSTSS